MVRTALSMSGDPDPLSEQGVVPALGAGDDLGQISRVEQDSSRSALGRRPKRATDLVTAAVREVEVTATIVTR